MTSKTNRVHKTYMQTLYKKIQLVAVCIGCIGCSSSESRVCPALYHPLVAEFTPISIGESLSLSGNNGTSISYTLKSTTKNEPFEKFAKSGHIFGGGDRSSINCELTEEHVYQSDELGTTLKIEFGQFEKYGADIEDQNLSVDVRFSNLDESTSNSAKFDTTNWTENRDFSDGKLTKRYTPSRIINQFEYIEISEITFSDNYVEPKDTTLSDIQIQRVAMSIGFGLVEYELLDGTIYSLLQ